MTDSKNSVCLALCAISATLLLLAFGCVSWGCFQPAAYADIEAATDGMRAGSPAINPTLEESGSCGDNLTWQLFSNGLLVISGSGEMYGEPGGNSIFKDFSSRITAVEIGREVTSVGHNAFWGCSSLASISFETPSSLESIGLYSFYRCASLTSINIPSSVTSIEGYAFCSCSSLTSIEIPSSVKTIKDHVFTGCDAITTATVPGNAAKMSSLFPDGYKKLTTVKYAEGSAPTAIVNSAFDGCISLTSIEIPSSVVSIGTRAFAGCSSLASARIPSSVASIGPRAYKDCSSLSSVSFEGLSVLESLGDYSFSDCSSLASIDIPASTMSIGNYAFDDCTALTSISFEEPSSLKTIGEYSFRNCSRLPSIEIPASVWSIDNCAFSGCREITSVAIPPNVVKVSTTFPDCYKKLTSIRFAKGSLPREIRASAFEGCASIASFEIPSSVTSVGDRAFSGCSSLTSIEIPPSVESIGQRAFFCCTSLGSASFGTGSKLSSLGEYSFYGCSSIDSIEIPPSVKFVGSHSFMNCASLASVSFGSRPSLESIGDYLFKGCTSLSSIDIPSSVTSIGNSAFSGCSVLASVSFAAPSSLKAIGESSFSSCYLLTSIAIPPSVETMGAYSFYWCRSLSSITFEAPASLSKIGTDAFQDGASSVKVSCGASYYAYTYFGKSANFKYGTIITREGFHDDATGLEYVVDPNGTWIIGRTSKEPYLTIPAALDGHNVLGICPRAFAYDTTMCEVALPDSIANIGANAFSGCGSLKAVLLLGDEVAFGASCFGGLSYQSTIYVSRASTFAKLKDSSGFLDSQRTKVVLSEGARHLLSSASVVVDSVTYCGDAAQPRVTVSLAGTDLHEGIDYELLWNNNKHAGTATVTAQGTGLYAGLVQKTFQIDKADITGASVSLAADSVVYSGNEQKPKPTVSQDGKQLIENENYRLSYVNNCNAGIATVKVEGIGDYKNCVECDFEIVPARVTKIDLRKTLLVYTGKVQRPSIASVKAGNLTLGNRDYETSYSSKSSINAGKYIVAVKGRNNYAGIVKGSYEIGKAKNPAKISVKSSSIKSSAIKSKPQTVKALTVSKAQGKVTFTRIAKDSSNKLSVDKRTGKVKVKKGTMKGLYAIRVKILVAGNNNYKSLTKNVTVKVRIR